MCNMPFNRTITLCNYFVYDQNDECISDGFKCEEDAIEYAMENNYPVVKVHNYYRDPERGYKLYPDGNPEIIWVSNNCQSYSNFL